MRARGFAGTGCPSVKSVTFMPFRYTIVCGSIKGYIHRVPFADWFDRPCQCFCKGVKHPCARIVVGPVAYFNLATAVDWHPGFGRLLRYADENSRIRFLRGEL